MKTIILLVFISASGILFSQKGKCSVKSIGSKYNKLQLIQSVENADWCGVYHVTENFKLTFEDGSIVLLGNKEELNNTNTHIGEDCFQTSVVVDRGVYAIHESGVLLRRTFSQSKTKNIVKE